MGTRSKGHWLRQKQGTAEEREGWQRLPVLVVDFVSRRRKYRRIARKKKRTG